MRESLSQSKDGMQKVSCTVESDLMDTIQGFKINQQMNQPICFKPKLLKVKVMKYEIIFYLSSTVSTAKVYRIGSSLIRNSTGSSSDFICVCLVVLIEDHIDYRQLKRQSLIVLPILWLFIYLLGGMQKCVYELYQNQSAVAIN